MDFEGLEVFAFAFGQFVFYNGVDATAAGTFAQLGPQII
jgi:hypothetical protein